MKTRLLLVSVLLLAGPDLLACGDKFLVGSRGTRYQRAAVKRPPAAILIYASPSSPLGQSSTCDRVRATLDRAGYRTTTVDTPAKLDEALGRGAWDLVIVDAADSDLSARTSSAAVLPILYNPSRSELDRAKARYRTVIKAPVKTQSFLDSVDEAVAGSEKTRARDRQR